MCPEVPQKRQSLLSRRCCLSWGVSFPSFLSFQGRLGVVGFFCSEVEPLPWVEPKLLFFCLECEEPFWTCCQTWKSQTSVRSCFRRFRKHEFCGILHRIVPSIKRR